MALKLEGLKQLLLSPITREARRYGTCFGEMAMQIDSLSTDLVEKAFQFIANPHTQTLPSELQHLQPGHWQALSHLLAAIYAEKEVRLLN